MNPLKLIISSKYNLSAKYGKKFSKVNALLQDIKKADKKRGIDTDIVYIDDKVSMKKYGLTPLISLSPKDCKDAVDAIYKKKQAAYLLIFGAQDIIPFQELQNPAQDDDTWVPSDLPYACSAAYSRNINAFIGPNRVVGRLPDVPGKADLDYVRSLVDDVVKQQPRPLEEYMNYFAVTALVWTKSTQLSLQNMFGNAGKLLNSPPAGPAYSAADLAPMTHFYNCHGALLTASYYGQKGNSYPEALRATSIDGKISQGTIVAAECCYGGQMFNPDEEPGTLSVASNYLLNHAISFVGSSTVAYGPAESQGLADLITQYFIKGVLNGASAGRAMLEARQEFLSKSAPHLDPYELKTLAQFYLLGDPSIQAVSVEALDTNESNSLDNRRINLFSKGLMLQKTIAPAVVSRQKVKAKSKVAGALKQVLANTGFSSGSTEQVFTVSAKPAQLGLESKSMGGSIRFRTFTQKSKAERWNDWKVLVVKENDEQLLGWRIYHRK